MINSDRNDESLPALPLRQTGIATSARAGTDGQQELNRGDAVGIKINLLVTAAIFIAGCFFISACENDEKMIDDWSKKKIMVEEAKNIESFLSQEGKVKAKLTAPLMFRYDADTIYTEFPKTLHVDFYDDSTKIESWLDSKHGKYFESLEKVYLWDSVVVINIKGDTLKSSDLWWDKNAKLFYTEKYAEYRTKDRQIYPGKGLEATQDFQRITFKQPTGILNVSDKNFPK